MHRNDRNALVLCRWDRSHIYSPSGEHFPSLIQSHNPDSDPLHSSSGHVNKSTHWRKYFGCPANMILRLASRDYNARIFRSWPIAPKSPDCSNTKNKKFPRIPGIFCTSEISTTSFHFRQFKKNHSWITGHVFVSWLHEPRYPPSLPEL